MLFSDSRGSLLKELLGASRSGGGGSVLQLISSVRIVVMVAFSKGSFNIARNFHDSFIIKGMINIIIFRAHFSFDYLAISTTSVLTPNIR